MTGRGRTHFSAMAFGRVMRPFWKDPTVWPLGFGSLLHTPTHTHTQSKHKLFLYHKVLQLQMVLLQ